jgi:hypothetical protein
MSDPDPIRQSVHPDFDGHLERPLEDLSPEERLNWLQEILNLRKAVSNPRSAQPPSPNA